MASLAIVREPSAAGEVLTLRLTGNLDRGGAERLREVLATLGDQQVTVDFSRVREFCDLAVPLLTRSLDRPEVHCQGLDRHHERMFRYFGIVQEPGAAAPRAYWTPEDMVLM